MKTVIFGAALGQIKVVKKSRHNLSRCFRKNTVTGREPLSLLRDLALLGK